MSKRQAARVTTGIMQSTEETSNPVCACGEPASFRVRSFTPDGYRCCHCGASIRWPTTTEFRCSPTKCRHYYEIEFEIKSDWTRGYIMIDKDECNSCGRRNIVDLQCELEWFPGELEKLQSKRKEKKLSFLEKVFRDLKALASSDPTDAKELRFRLTSNQRYKVHIFCNESGGKLLSRSEGDGEAREVIVRRGNAESLSNQESQAPSSPRSHRGGKKRKV